MNGELTELQPSPAPNSGGTGVKKGFNLLRLVLQILCHYQHNYSFDYLLVIIIINEVFIINAAIKKICHDVYLYITWDCGLEVLLEVYRECILCELGG